MAHIHIHIHGGTDDDWSPEARKAAAEARRTGSPAKRPPNQVVHANPPKPLSQQFETGSGGRQWPAGTLAKPNAVEHRPAVAARRA